MRSLIPAVLAAALSLLVLSCGGGMTQTATLTPTGTGQPDFNTSVSPSSLSVQRGKQGTSTVTTAISGGFDSATSLSASSMPSGTTVSFDPNPIPAPGSGSSTMTITVGSNTGTGTYAINVAGNGGGYQHSVTAALTVLASVSLTWSGSIDQVVGYNVHSSFTSGGPYTRLNSSLIPDTSYLDQTVQSGFTYYYVVTAVNAQGQESGYSNQAEAMVP